MSPATTPRPANGLRSVKRPFPEAIELGPRRAATWHDARVRILELRAIPFPLPLLEPFTISRATVDTTRAVLVRIEAELAGQVVVGLGEAALPLGSSEQPDELLATVVRARSALVSRELDDLPAVTGALDNAEVASNTARAGLCSALAPFPPPGADRA